MNGQQLKNLNSIFAKKIFRVPDYQRGYSWEESQLKDFWEDLLNVYQSEQKYYTGMLSFRILDKEDVKAWDTRWMTDTGNYEANHIVDGQQRLTTIEILIKTIISFCEEKNIDRLNGENLSFYKEQFLERINPVLGDKSYIFGYEVDEESDNYFKYKIMGCDGEIDLTESIYTRNLSYAQKFFYDNLIELLREGNEEIVIETAKPKLDKLFSTLINNMMFNIYYVEDSFNVFLAFEAMNNRGKRLSNLELLKNRLIYLSTIFNGKDNNNDTDEDIDKVNDEDINKDTLRKNIDKAWKEIYKQLGCNPENKLDDEEYLKNHWIVYFGYNRSTANAYSNFLLKKYFIQTNIIGFKKAVITKEEEDNLVEITPALITKYINSIKSLSSKWMYINNPEMIKDNNNEELLKIKNILVRLNHLGQGYFLPLIMVLYNDLRISNTKKIEIFEKIEKYQFLEFRIFYNNSSYQNFSFYKEAYDIYHSTSGEELEKCLESTIKKLDEIDNMENGYIDSSAVKTFAAHLFKNEGFYDWGSKHYVLFEYEKYLKGNSETNHIIPKEYFLTQSKKISIEHIYPQNPKDQSWIDAFNEYDDEKRNRLLNSLGNLLPLSLSINTKLQNISFEEKKKEIKNKETGEIERAGYESGSYNEREICKEKEWTSKEILKRGIKIVNFIEDKWGFKFKSFEDKKVFLGLDFLEYDEKNL